MKLVRDILFDYLRDLEVGYIFGVPGTNEIPIIDGTNIQDNNVTYVPCLHENIALGAAMGYARMTGKPGIVLLHVTPGIGHSLGNLFNAYKSHVPLVVLCGQQHSELILQEPLLASDLVQVARQYTKWSHEVRSPEEFSLVLQRAFKLAITPPTGPVFVSIPWDFTVQEATFPGPAKVTRIASNFVGDRSAVADAGKTLASAENPIIIAGDGVGYANAWEELQTLAELLGAPVYTEQLSSMMNYPNHLYHWQGELPGTQQEIQRRFKWHDVAFLCGFNAQAQLVVFDYDLGPLIPDSVKQVYLHNDPWEIGKNNYGEVAILGDIKATLPLLCDAIVEHPSYNPAAASDHNQELRRLSGKRDEQFAAYLQQISPVPAVAPAETGTPINGTLVAAMLAYLQKEMGLPLVYVHEAISDSVAFQKYLRYEDPISYYAVEGGSLGYSMPASLGIKLAVKDQRTVVNAVGDGSALFYPQVWWTAAKFDLPILYLIMNNREYKTLIAGLGEIENIYGWTPSGPPSYLYLKEPPVSLAEIAASFGVRGERVADPANLKDAMRRGLNAVQAGKPYVLEVLTDPSTTLAEESKPRLDIVFAAKEELL